MSSQILCNNKQQRSMFLFTAPLEVIQDWSQFYKWKLKALACLFWDSFFTAISSVPYISLCKALNGLLSSPATRGYQMYD